MFDTSKSKEADSHNPKIGQTLRSYDDAYLC